MSSNYVETGHLDTIHDAQLDFYGRRLATASSDRTIKVFDVAGDSNALVAELKGHEGPVWQVQWAHPKFQSVLASASYDRTVIVWKETSQNNWSEAYRHTAHELSVNGLSWAPHDCGLILACASSDGTVSVVTFRADASAEVAVKIQAHPAGVNAVSWSPYASTGAGGSAGKRFVTAGCDNLVIVWRLSDMNDWGRQHVLEGHSDWVRDVAWAPSVGGVPHTIASAGQDRTVIIWREENTTWRKTLIQLEAVPWRVSWSLTGNILAVSCDDNSVTLFKEAISGEWTKIEQDAAQHQPQ